MPMLNVVLGGGFSEPAPKVQEIPLVPHASAVVRLTGKLNPLSDCTVTVPEELPPAPKGNVSGVAADDMLKSGVPVQLLSLNEPIVVYHTPLEVTG
jgi:hypothetical protein